MVEDTRPTIEIKYAEMDTKYIQIHLNGYIVGRVWLYDCWWYCRFFDMNTSFTVFTFKSLVINVEKRVKRIIRAITKTDYRIYSTFSPSVLKIFENEVIVAS